MALTLAYAVLALRPDETPFVGPLLQVSERSRPLCWRVCPVRRQVPTLREYKHMPDSLCSALVECVTTVQSRLTRITVNLPPTDKKLKINSALADPTWASRGGGGGRYLSTTLSGRSRLEE